MGTIVECASGNKYELKLGPRLLSQLNAGYRLTVPASLMKKMATWTNEHGDDEPAPLMALATPEEIVIMNDNEANLNVRNVERTLKSFNGEKVEDIDEFLDEMSVADFNELVETIDLHMKEFTDGRAESGESTTSSNEKGAEKVTV